MKIFQFIAAETKSCKFSSLNEMLILIWKKKKITVIVKCDKFQERIAKNRIEKSLFSIKISVEYKKTKLPKDYMEKEKNQVCLMGFLKSVHILLHALHVSYFMNNLHGGYSYSAPISSILQLKSLSNCNQVRYTLDIW